MLKNLIWVTINKENGRSEEAPMEMVRCFSFYNSSSCCGNSWTLKETFFPCIFSQEVADRTLIRPSYRHPPWEVLGGQTSNGISGEQLPWVWLLSREFTWFGGLVTKSCPKLVAPWTVAHQVPLSMGFSRQEYWSGLSIPSPEDLPDPGIEPRSPALQADG